MTDRLILAFVMEWAWTHGVHWSVNCPGLTGNWADARQDCYRQFHPLLVAWGMTIFQARVSPTTKRFWAREVKSTAQTALSQRHGSTGSGVGALEFQTRCFEHLYLPSSSSIRSSTATAIWKLSFFFRGKSTWTNSLPEIWSGWGLLCVSKGTLLLYSPQYCISPCHVDLHSPDSIHINPQLLKWWHLDYISSNPTDFATPILFISQTLTKGIDPFLLSSEYTVF